jgi:hypothetical protein
MLSMHSAPLLLGTLLVPLIGLMVWGFLRSRQGEANGAMPGGGDNLLVGFSILAGFALSVLVLYLVGAQV